MNLSDYKLNNGAEIEIICSRYVLAIFNGEWVTWAIDNKGNAYWGHYFGSDHDAAQSDFWKRATA